LCDALWPDAEGDAARESLKVALHRLRGLVGDKAVIQKDRRLRLNRESCWVDAWALIESAVPVSRNGRIPPPAAALQPLLRLYRGPFLPEDDALEGAARMRGDSRAALEALIHSQHPGLEDPPAVDLLEQVLTVDPGSQVFCESLMRRVIRQGDPVRAVHAYERLKFAQQADPATSIQPTLETLYRTAVGATRRTG
jgi:DNA-binding SARP family transcriptional activator